MKLWKGVVLAIVLLSTVLSFLLARTMLPAGLPGPWASAASMHPSSAAAAPAPPPLASQRVKGHRRVARAAEGMGPLLSEFSYLFQSFTEGELQRFIGTLVERKAAREGTEASRRTQGRRTKRARKGSRPCQLHEVILKVRDFGLGYESDETFPFRYCSGKCTNHRRNYDMVMEHMRLGAASGERGGVRRRDRERYGPCCRPTKYEKNMSFLTANYSFVSIQNVSARECGCV